MGICCLCELAIMLGVAILSLISERNAKLRRIKARFGERTPQAK
jgi:hypothetical protein